MKEPDLFIASGKNDTDAATLLNNLFLEAANLGASDIHFQEHEGTSRVRLRVPAGMQEAMVIPLQFTRTVDEKIRSRCQLSLQERRTPLDGRMRLRYPKKKLDIRVAISPGISGQLTVCRLLDQSNATRGLDQIEMSEMVRDGILQLIEEPHGLFIVTGPTGSGKTTTLYAILSELNDDSRNIITIENPVEYEVANIHQINVDIHVSFAQALRAVLRQDPDVILVGEVRDAETAQIAVQAAITGHLVLTTMHANNSALAITRLLDLGVDPMTLSAALRGVTAQRLVRRVAPDYTPETKSPNEVEQGWLAMHGVLDRNLKFPKVTETSGYAGYVPLIEMITADGTVRKSLNRGMAAIYNAAARQPQFETLARAGAVLAGQGITTLDEVRRVTSNIDAVQVQVKRIGQVLVEMGVIDNRQLYKAVAHQTLLRRAGTVRQLGEILVEDGLCCKADIMEALGHSGDASMVLRRLVEGGLMAEDQWKVVVSGWKEQPGTSLFDLAVESGACKKDDIYAATGLSY